MVHIGSRVSLTSRSAADRHRSRSRLGSALRRRQEGTLRDLCISLDADAELGLKLFMGWPLPCIRA
jgi:hypothetical protein